MQTANQKRDLAEILQELNLQQPQSIRRKLEQDYIGNDALEKMALGSHVMQSIKQQEPKSLVNTVMNVPNRSFNTQIGIELPKQVLNVETVSRIEHLKPDLDYKNSEYAYIFKEETTQYINAIMQAFNLQNNQHLKVQLKKPLNQTKASELNTILIQMFQQAQYINDQVELTNQHCATFVNALTKYILKLKKPKINSFDIKSFDKSTTIIIEAKKVEQLLNNEFKYQRLTYIPQAPEPEPEVKKIVRTEEQMSQKCNAMYKRYEKILQDRERKQREAQEEKLKSYTFQPQVSTVSHFTKKLDNDLGVSSYLEKNKMALRDLDQEKVTEFLNQIIAEADNFCIKLTDDFILKARDNLAQCQSKQLREQIVKDIVDKFQKKYHEYQQIKYQQKVQSGEIKQMQTTFGQYESVFNLQIANASNSPYNSKLEQTKRQKQLIDTQKQKDLKQQQKIQDEKLRKANLRAQIYKQCRKGNTLNIDINLVKERFGQEGIDVLLEQQRKIYSASQDHNDEEIEHGNNHTVLYSSVK